jgi:hypothetical protein
MSNNRQEVTDALRKLGIEWMDAMELRRIAMTLHRWNEAECNGDVERDESTGKTYAVYGMNGPGKITRYRTPDKESGALTRLQKIMLRYPLLVPYVQGDPRGASLYILKREDVGNNDIDSVYNRGVAVYK